MMSLMRSSLSPAVFTAPQSGLAAVSQGFALGHGTPGSSTAIEVKPSCEDHDTMVGTSLRVVCGIPKCTQGLFACSSIPHLVFLPETLECSASRAPWAVSWVINQHGRRWDCASTPCLRSTRFRDALDVLWLRVALILPRWLVSQGPSQRWCGHRFFDWSPTCVFTLVPLGRQGRGGLFVWTPWLLSQARPALLWGQCGGGPPI